MLTLMLSPLRAYFDYSLLPLMLIFADTLL